MLIRRADRVTPGALPAAELLEKVVALTGVELDSHYASQSEGIVIG